VVPRSRSLRTLEGDRRAGELRREVEKVAVSYALRIRTRSTLENAFENSDGVDDSERTPEERRVEQCVDGEAASSPTYEESTTPARTGRDGIGVFQHAIAARRPIRNQSQT